MGGQKGALIAQPIWNHFRALSLLHNATAAVLHVSCLPFYEATPREVASFISFTITEGRLGFFSVSGRATGLLVIAENSVYCGKPVQTHDIMVVFG